jgi:hypothetical protein
MPRTPQPQRDVLPIPDITAVGLTTYDAKDPDTAFPPIEELRPPEGAPNVLIVLIVDLGFGASTATRGANGHPSGPDVRRRRRPPDRPGRAHPDRDGETSSVCEAFGVRVSRAVILARCQRTLLSAATQAPDLSSA